MRIGKLRHRIAIQRYVQGESEIGDPIQYWDTLCHAWASIEPISGREFWEAERIAAEITHKVTMRPTETRTIPKDRIVFDSRILEIVSVLDIEERGRELNLLCKEDPDEVWEPEPNGSG